MVSVNVTHMNTLVAEAPKKNLKSWLLFDRGWCYYHLHNLRRASSSVAKHFPERWGLFVLRIFKNGFWKRFPRTPSKGSIFQAMSFRLFLTLLESRFAFSLEQAYTETMIEPTKRGRPKSSKRISKERKALTVTEDQIVEVFNFWVTTCKSNARRAPILDEKRRICIGAAIHDYTVEVCRNAIEGCTMSDFHMGRNKSNKRYDDIELILRDSEHIERFLEFYEKAAEEPW